MSVVTRKQWSGSDSRMLFEHIQLELTN
jgi:hypothetical protein